MQEIEVQALAEDFARCDAKLVEWGEEAAIRNFKDRVDNWNATSSQVSTLLTLLLAGIGGSLAFTIQCLVADPNRRALGSGAAVACFYLVVLAIILM